MRTPDVLLIGTGRMAYHLGHAMVKAGVKVVGVAGRNSERLTDLARFLDRPSFRLDHPLPTADLALVATSDDSIAEVAHALPASNMVVAHTAGAMGLEALAPHTHRGAIWPIQTLSHGAPIDLAHVPMVVDGNTDEARDAMLRLARSISDSVYQLPHAQRELLHLAAVLTSNFPVFLVSEAQRLLRQEKLPPDLLMPLWRTTANKVSTIGPEQALTGPARRGDATTIQRHLALLTAEPDLRRAYALLSEMILRAHGHTNDGR
ncbi:MAG TPA: DUF2520 domain-containing protein [Flavobacteriales bacterium]|nr:DUF2520 domain-containing protein [Flavobacteriales bacterium]